MSASLVLIVAFGLATGDATSKASEQPTIVEEMRGRLEAVVQHEAPLRVQPNIDCGIYAMATVQLAFGDTPDWDALNRILRPQRTGASVAQLVEAAQTLGYHAAAVRLRREDLSRLRHPAILHVRKSGRPEDGPNHFSVVFPSDEDGILFLDPPRDAGVIAPAQLDPIWEGVAVVIARTPLSPADVLDPPVAPRVLAAGCAAGAMLGLSLTASRVRRWVYRGRSRTA